MDEANPVSYSDEDRNGATHYAKEDGKPLCGARIYLSRQSVPYPASCRMCARIAEKDKR